VANNAEWVYNTRASRRFCTNKEVVQDFKDVIDSEYVYIGNSTTARVMGKENILLKFNSGKLLSITNVLYVSSLLRNLVSSILLNKVGLKLVLEMTKLLSLIMGSLLGKDT